MVTARNYAGATPPRPQRWLAFPYIARDVMTLAAGGAGILKGTSMASVIADVTQGRDFFGGRVRNQVGAPADVIAIVPEDREDAMRFRLGAAGANLQRVWNLTYDGRTGDDGLPGKTRLDERGLRSIRSLATWINEPAEQGGLGSRLALIYIDPLMAVKPRGVSITQNDQARDHIVDPLDGLAERFGCSLILLQHTVKDGSIGGSQGLVDAARLVLFMQRVKGSDGHARLSVFKSNIGPDAEHGAADLRYCQTGAESELTRRVQWMDDADTEPVTLAGAPQGAPTPLYPYRQRRAAQAQPPRPAGLSARELLMQQRRRTGA